MNKSNINRIRMEYCEFTKFWEKYYNRILHNNFILPNRKGFDALIDGSQPPKNQTYLREALKLSHGTIKLDTDLLFDTMFEHKTNWSNNKADRETVLSAFLFNRQVTIVSPESFFDCGDLKCPDCVNCAEVLKFKEVVKSARLVHGISYEDEIIFTCLYTCSNRHTVNTIEKRFLELLPAQIAAKYKYFVDNLSPRTTLFNVDGAYALLQSKSLNPIHSFIDDGKRYDFGARIRSYLLYIGNFSNAKEFPKPPKSLFKSVKGGTDTFFGLSEKALREIRQSGYLYHKDKYERDMMLTVLHKAVAFDSGYKFLKIANSDVEHCNFGKALDGPDKGRIFAYSAHSGGESHYKSARMYEGVANRMQQLNHKLEYACVDTCCNNIHYDKVVKNNHIVSETLGLKCPPKGDAFHSLKGFDEEVNECIAKQTFKNELHKVIFEDKSTAESIIQKFPARWMEIWEYVEKDGGLKDTFPYEAFEKPSFFFLKFVAFAKCFKAQLKKECPDFLEQNNDVTINKRLIEKAVLILNNKWNQHVPQVFREKEEMFLVLSNFCKKLFGYELKFADGAVYFDFSNYVENVEFNNSLVLNRLSDSKDFRDNSDGSLFKPLKKDGSVYRDQNGVIWKPTISDQRFSKSPIFQPGDGDGKILGKNKCWNAFLNFGLHIVKGCLDYAQFGDELYRNHGLPATKASGLYEGLVKCSSSAGQNIVEALFRVLNQATFLTQYYALPECETRVAHGVLEANRSNDLNNGKEVAPTAIYWFWSALNQIAFAIFGCRIFNFRDPMMGLVGQLPQEPYLGFNNYRYEQAAANGRNHHDATKLAMEVQLTKSSLKRWFEIKYSIAIPCGELEKTRPTEALLFADELVTHSILEITEDSAIVSEDKRAAMKENSSANGVAAAMKKVNTQSNRGVQQAHSKKKRLISDNEVIAKSLILKKSKIASPEEKGFLREVIAVTAANDETVLKADGTISVKSLVEKATIEYNKAALSPRKSLNFQPSTVIDKKVTKALLKETVKAKTNSVPKQVPIRNKYRKEPLKWPLTRDMVEKGLTYDKSKRYFGILKKWKLRGGGNLRNLMEAVNHSHYGLREIFSSNRLIEISYDEITKAYAAKRLNGKATYRYKVKRAFQIDFQPKKTVPTERLSFEANSADNMHVEVENVYREEYCF